MRDLFKKIVVERGYLSEDQLALVLDFHQFEGGKRHPAEVAVSLSVMTDSQARQVAELMAAGGKTVSSPKMARQIQQTPSQAIPQGGGMMISKIINAAIEAKASDVHIHADEPPFMRVQGLLTSGFAPALPEKRFAEELKQILSKEQLQTFQQDGAVDLCIDFAKGFRLRINVFKANHGLSACMRLIPPQIPSLTQLNLPREIGHLLEFHQGLIVIAGSAGSGKTTTLASLIQRLNNTRRGHVITVEDPIEYVFTPDKCSVTQRQIGVHTNSYASALHGALREDPDVIVIGELCDTETIRAALIASETGHLVLGTLHTRSAESTLARLLDAFGEEESQMRGTLADALVGVFVQQLERSTRGGLVPVVEMIINNNAIAHCIRQRKLHQLQSLMQSGRGKNMITWEDSVKDLQARKLLSTPTVAKLLSEHGR